MQTVSQHLSWEIERPSSRLLLGESPGALHSWESTPSHPIGPPTAESTHLPSLSPSRPAPLLPPLDVGPPCLPPAFLGCSKTTTWLFPANRDVNRTGVLVSIFPSLDPPPQSGPSRVPGLFENNHVALVGHFFDWLANRDATRLGMFVSLLLPPFRSPSPIATLPHSHSARERSRGPCQPHFRLVGQSRHQSNRYVDSLFSIPLPQSRPSLALPHLPSIRK